MNDKSNNTINDWKIWYPYEVFYIESMLTITRAVKADMIILKHYIEEMTSLNANNIPVIIDCVQNIITRSASLSRYFWSISNKPIHSLRAELLRDAFDIKENNALKELKMIRNFIEHFDEKMDSYLNAPISGNIYTTYVGYNINSSKEVDKHFRAYFINDWIFKILDKQIFIKPIAFEVIRINDLLEKFRRNGKLPRLENKQN
ncbi:MAG: hypothetical protein JWN78_779 [Bacteroidota bacterium]|nr:hypothetical protein [Bacteroidota bacterium]